ncbi:MAG: cytochrome c [Pyrinomonadaceae bacterium]
MLSCKAITSGSRGLNLRLEAAGPPFTRAGVNRELPTQRRRGFAVRAHAKLVLVLLLLSAYCLLLIGCRRDMQDQPKVIAYRASSFYKDGSGSRPLVEGTVPRGYLRDEREYYTGKKSGTVINATPQTQSASPQSASTSSATLYPADVETIPMSITKADLDRGQERYNIYCSACHGMTGYGDGIVARRGFNKPSPANYHQDRLRQAPVGHFFDVMTNGWGAMPSYASQVPVEDRWKIIAYIRALQLSQQPPAPLTAAGAGSGATVTRTQINRE